MAKRVALGALIAVLSLAAMAPLGRLTVADMNDFEQPWLQPHKTIASTVDGSFEQPFLQPFVKQIVA